LIWWIIKLWELFIKKCYLYFKCTTWVQHPLIWKWTPYIGTHPICGVHVDNIVENKLSFLGYNWSRGRLTLIKTTFTCFLRPLLMTRGPLAHLHFGLPFHAFHVYFYFLSNAFHVWVMFFFFFGTLCVSFLLFFFFFFLKIICTQHFYFARKLV
jgi:hypothetical protein